MNKSTFSKILLTFSCSLLFGCSNSAEIGNVKPANNSNNPVSPTVTPLSEADITAKNKIEEALKKAGFTDLKVDTTTIPFSIRGTVARDKMVEAIFVAQQAAGRDLKNEIVEKK